MKNLYSLQKFILVTLFSLASVFGWGQVNYSTISSTYTQNFDNLRSSGTSGAITNGSFNNVNASLNGWYFYETGTSADTKYTGGTGSSTNGDTFSFGTVVADRALGGVQSSSVNPTIGFYLKNTTGQTITSVNISYIGEQWRLGALGRVDRLDFQYSTTATSLSTGTWTDVDALDFTAPITSGTIGAIDGNAVGNKTAISFTITGLSIANNSTIFIRWNDFNPTGADDGLAVDDFSFTASSCTAPTINTQPSNTTVYAPNTAGFSVSASGTSLTYQWQYNDSVNGWQNVSTGIGGTSASYTTAATTTAMSGYQYRAIVYSGTCSTTSNVATLTVNPAVVTNITGGGVNIVGKFQNPGYQQPTNCDVSDKRVLQYRKVSTTISNPSDGRGQWATTLNAVSSPSTTLSLGEVYNGNYDPNNNGDGFLFTNGGGCGNTGNYTNKWNFSGNGQCGLNAVSIANYVTGGGTNMGINMSNIGFYTFVLKDNASSSNGYYVGYTTNAPVTISGTSQTMLCPTSATVTATLNTAPSSQEKFYLRYNTSNDFGGTATTSQVLGTVSGTTVTFNVTGLSAGNTYYYYILSTTHGSYQTLSEVDKSLSCLKFLDNGGSNYSLTTPAAISINTQPVGNSYCQNATPTALSVTATGSSLSYQWYNNGTNNSNTGGTLISGATSNTLAVANISTTTAGTTYYYCNIFTGTCTTPTATNAVAIVVNDTPTITGATSVCVNNTIQLTGSGTPNASNPWVSSNTAVATVDATGLVNGVSAGTSTITYKNSNGCTTTTTVTVNASTAISTQPTAQSTTAGNTATFTVVATGANLTYQWQVSTDCGATWSNVGTNSSAYTTPATDSSYDQNRYRVIVSGSCGGSKTSNEVVLSVNLTANCLTDDFTINPDGWTSALGVTYSGTGSSSGTPLTVNVPSGTWVLYNNSLNTGSNYLQYNSAGAYTQLPNLSKPNKITVTARTSGSSGNGNLTLQYKNGSGVWTDIETKGWSGTSEVSYDFLINNTISSVATQYRIYYPTLMSATYLAKVQVTCTVLPSSATDYTWIGGANTTSWTDACNWSPKGVPTSVDNVIFNSNSTYLLNITDSRTVNNFTLNGTGNFNMSATGVLTINGNVTYGDTATATLDCASKVNIASTASQTIPPLNYGNLDTTGGARVLLSNKTVGICNTFTPGNGTYTVNQSTIDYKSTSNQIISDKITYYNLTLSGSGTKTPSGAISVDTNGTVKIMGTAIANFTNYNLASTSANTTAFTMDGGRLILGTTGTQPNMRGAYNLTGGVVEFANTNASAQTIRTASYQNIEVTGNNVGNSSGNITLNSAGTFTVKSGGIFSINDNSITCPSGNGSITVENNGAFKTGNNKGFNGFVATLSDNSAIHANITNITLADGSTVEYTRADVQTITEFKPLPASPTTADYTNANYGYYNLKISGDNTATPASAKTVTGTGVYVRNNLDVVAPAILKIEKDKAINVYNNISSASENNFIVESDGNLLQVNKSASNTGKITAKRNAKLKRLDYNYWGSPVSGQQLKAFSPGTLNSRFYIYQESNDSFVTVDPTTNFETGKGYAIRASNTAPTSITDPLATKDWSFIGIPNNGDVSFTLLKSSTGNGYNLVANPYPSNINLNQLYTSNNTDITGTFYFWTNINPNPAMQYANYPLPGYFNNYATYNLSGGNPPAHPTVTDATEVNKITPEAIIKPGQGFIVQATGSGDGKLDFYNTHRVKDTNTKFFNNRMASSNEVVDRYRVQLTTPLGLVNTILVAYKEGSTLDFEGNYDAKLLVESPDSFYSKIGVDKMIIQGRGYPLNNNDVVELGTTFYQSGTHTFSIESKEGVFANGQAIYLHDKLLGSYTDLQLGDYTFSATQGESVNRFEIVYKTSGILSTDNTVKYGLRVYQSGEHYVVEADKVFKEVRVYDASGRLLSTIKSGKKQLMIEKNKLVGGFNLFSIIFADDIVNKKVISK